jgi:hypothetical protein
MSKLNCRCIPVCICKPASEHQAASTRNDAPVSLAEIEMLYVDARDGYTRENYVSQSNVMQGLKRVLDKLGVKYE